MSFCRLFREISPTSFLPPACPRRGFHLHFSVICNSLHFFYYFKFCKFHLKLEILLLLRVTFGKQLLAWEGA